MDIYIYIYAHISIYIYIYVYIYILYFYFVCFKVCMHACIYVWLCVCIIYMHACMSYVPLHPAALLPGACVGAGHMRTCSGVGWGAALLTPKSILKVRLFISCFLMVPLGQQYSGRTCDVSKLWPGDPSWNQASCLGAPRPGQIQTS